ncbi:hypothetical protein Vi05172_g1798 [Venturia inaequalis]|nr:hypothetical protein Vi05172_g1798 [Venturia inaequalis]
MISTAIKLVDMNCHPDYLAAIVRPETRPKIFWTVGDQTTKWPKMVQVRFSLKLCREFTAWKDQVCLDSLTGPFGYICPHLTFIDAGVSESRLNDTVPKASRHLSYCHARLTRIWVPI